jgi:predicted ATP-grasp superfamily ATP-dependent carboligase
MPNGGRNVLFIPDQESLFRFCEGIGYEQHSRIIMQEYISGGDWIYHGFTDPQSDLCVGFTGRKLLSFPPAGGATALGLSIYNDTLRRQAESLLSSISYSGIIDMDWRRDKRDGQYKLMDCNPRVGMNFRMFENQDGIDVIRAQHLNLTGRTVANSPMIEGRLFAVESYRLLSHLRGGRSATLDSTEHPRTTTTSREFAWWSKDDPLPIFAMSVLLLVRAASRRLKEMWKSASLRFSTFGFHRK